MTANEKSQRARAYREANRAKVLAGKKASYERNKEQILAKEKSKREADKEGFYGRRRQRYAAQRKERQAAARARYATDPTHAARVLANNRKYRAARLDEYRERDKHYSKAYQVRHPERFEQTHRRASLTRRALVIGAFVESVDALAVFERDNGVCGICHRRVDPKSKWHVDHVIPLSKGGMHSYANVQLAHARCNLSKRASLPMGQLGLLQKAAR